jgi:hypothetical protein
MDPGRWLCRARFLLLAGVAVLAACGPRPATPPAGTAPPPTAPAPEPAAPGTPPSDAPGGARGGPRMDRPLADAERGPVLFSHWRAGRTQLESFEEYLVREQVAQVVPTYQLLRSASMWKECRAEPFQLPPPEAWPRVSELLVLLRELQRQEVLSDFEVVSAYRDPRLNRCAGGAPGSSHQVFAVDIAPLAEADAERLCRFWREHGREWDMGVSRYPSGRVHIDRNGFRTWGASHKRGSSYCLQ